MHNLAHYDPELRKRNVSAMAHGSKLDEEIFSEFQRIGQNSRTRHRVFGLKCLSKNCQISLILKILKIFRLGNIEDR